MVARESKSKKGAKKEEQRTKLADLQGFAAEIQRESDRATAILGGAILDQHLDQLLRTFMIDDPERVDRLLEPECPVGAFGAKLLLAHCLGLLDERLFRILNGIKPIRNAFAHELHGLEFDTPRVAKHCSELRRLLEFPTGFPDSPRFAFIAATFSARQSLWGFISSYEVNGQKRQIPKWQVLAKWQREDPSEATQ